MVKNTQYKNTLRVQLAWLGVGMDNGLYYNDLCHDNFTTSRRIKVRVSRELSEVELGGLAAALGKEFDTKIDVKNYRYYGPCVLVFFRR